MLISTVGKQKETKHISIKKEKLKLALFDMIVYTENPNDKLLELIRLQSIAISTHTHTHTFAYKLATIRKCRYS